MKTSPILLISAIVVSGIIGFFIGRSSAPSQDTAVIAEKNESVNTSGNEKAKTEDSATIATPATATETTNEAGTQPAEPQPATTTAVATNSNDKPAAATGGAILERLKMGVSDDKISSVLESVARNMEAKKLAYVSSLKQDCSGIFHQLKDSIQARIPALRGSGYQYPDFKTVRSSRQIADWYYQKGNLLFVEDPVASRNSIRPGSVMFFARPDKRFRNMTIEMLTDRNNNYTSNGAIMHVGVVTSIQTDADGNVIAYTMMHGRNTKYPASRSGSKEVQSTSNPDLPAFGNWSQQWVAVANIATPM